MALCKVRYRGQFMAYILCRRSTVSRTSGEAANCISTGIRRITEDAVFGSHFSRHIRYELAVACINLSRFQRAANKCPSFNRQLRQSHSPKLPRGILQFFGSTL
jgi:hypothetical protein